MKLLLNNNPMGFLINNCYERDIKGYGEQAVLAALQ